MPGGQLMRAASIAVSLLLSACSATAPPRELPAADGAPAATGPTSAQAGPAAAPPQPSVPGTSPPPRVAEPPLLDLESRGCFAWSSNEQAIACIEDRSSIQRGCREELVVFGSSKDAGRRHRIVDVPAQCLGDPPRALDEAVRSELEARFAAASFERLPEPAATLEPGDSREVGAATISFRRTKKRSVSIQNAGSWDVFDDDVTVTCGAKQRSVLRAVIEGPTGSTVTVVDTGSSWIALWYATSFGIEGDFGGRTDVALVDRSTCTVVRPR